MLHNEFDKQNQNIWKTLQHLKREWNSEKEFCSPDWELAGSPGCLASLCEWVQVTVDTSTCAFTFPAHLLGMKLVWIWTRLERTQELSPVTLAAQAHWRLRHSARGPWRTGRWLPLACMVLEYVFSDLNVCFREISSLMTMNGWRPRQQRLEKQEMPSQPWSGHYPQTPSQTTLAQASSPSDFLPRKWHDLVPLRKKKKITLTGVWRID